MQKLTKDDLYTLESYAEKRPVFRSEVLAHKKRRTLHVGPNAGLYFEDRLTMQYQVQEMLRIERIFERSAIEEELEAYNPLIPDGSNWKATFMIEYPDVEERKARLAELIGIEDKVWMQVADFSRVYAVADEDLERENADKTSSVHFLRWELSPEMVSAVKEGASISIGIDHPNYNHSLDPIPSESRDALAADLD